MKNARLSEPTPEGKSRIVPRSGMRAGARALTGDRHGSEGLHPVWQHHKTIGNQAAQHLVQSCPVFPRGCPFGGVCHTCPAGVRPG